MLAQAIFDWEPRELCDRIRELLARFFIRHQHVRALLGQPLADIDPAAKVTQAEDGNAFAFYVVHAEWFIGLITERPSNRRACRSRIARRTFPSLLSAAPRISSHDARKECFCWH